MTESKLVKVTKKVEDVVVDTYQKIENAVTGTYEKIEDKFVGDYLTKDGETIEEAKIRLKNEEEQRKAEQEKVMKGEN